MFLKSQINTIALKATRQWTSTKTDSKQYLFVKHRRVPVRRRRRH